MKGLEKTCSSVGIDVGLMDFAVLSNGEVVANPKFLRKLEKKLIREQRILSRRKEGSNNWNKQRIKVARIYEHIVNARTDYLQKNLPIRSSEWRSDAFRKKKPETRLRLF